MDVATSLQGLPSFLAYFAAALVAEAVFLAVYMAVTPHHELRLIRGGNPAAAVSLGGAVLGFTLPIASIVAHAASVVDFAVWALIALVAQLVAFFIVVLLLRGLADRIEQGSMAAGTALAFASVAIGVLNAACMTY